MSRKQEIYAELLMWSICHVRNIQTWPWWWRLRMRDVCWHETELVHNLYVSILDPEFGAHDIWFLNHQARTYCRAVGSKRIGRSGAQIELIRELFSLLPEEMKD